MIGLIALQLLVSGWAPGPVPGLVPPHPPAAAAAREAPSPCSGFGLFVDSGGRGVTEL